MREINVTCFVAILRMPTINTMKKIIIPVIAVVAAVLIGVIVWATQSQKTGDSSTSNQKMTDSTKTYTKQDVAKHNSSSDCWTIIDGNVYDITSYIPRHPGGDEILRACGIDGSSLFDSRHTENGERVGSGTGHSAEAQAMLETMLVGRLGD